MSEIDALSNTGFWCRAVVLCVRAREDIALDIWSACTEDRTSFPGQVRRRRLAAIHPLRPSLLFVGRRLLPRAYTCVGRRVIQLRFFFIHFLQIYYS
jgi:hypothetical protein